MRSLKHVVRHRVLVIIVAIASTSCAVKTENEESSVPADSVASSIQNKIRSSSSQITGDFNGDKKEEVAWADTSGMILFSDNKIPPVHLLPGMKKGHLINQGDFYYDGSDELSFVPVQDTGKWSVCLLYVFNGRKWLLAVPAFRVYGTEGDYVEPDSVQALHAIITEFSISKKEGVKSKVRSVKLN